MDINDFMGERHYVDWINEMGGHVEVLDGGKEGIIVAVSYTHLDVYKRQDEREPLSPQPEPPT